MRRPGKMPFKSIKFLGIFEALKLTRLSKSFNRMKHSKDIFVILTFIGILLKIFLIFVIILILHLGRKLYQRPSISFIMTLTRINIYLKSIFSCSKIVCSTYTRSSYCWAKKSIFRAMYTGLLIYSTTYSDFQQNYYWTQSAECLKFFGHYMKITILYVMVSVWVLVFWNFWNEGLFLFKHLFD